MTGLVVAVPFAFHGVDVPLVEYKGQPAIFAHHLGRALGLGESRDVGRVVREDPENEEGLDYVVLRGEELAALKEAGVIDPRIEAATLLLEGGYYQYLYTARVRLGVEFRRKLKREVIPAYRALAAKPAVPALPRVQNTLRTSTALYAQALAMSPGKEQAAVFRAAERALAIGLAEGRRMLNDQERADRLARLAPFRLPTPEECDAVDVEWSRTTRKPN